MRSQNAEREMITTGPSLIFLTSKKKNKTHLNLIPIPHLFGQNPCCQPYSLRGIPVFPKNNHGRTFQLVHGPIFSLGKLKKKILHSLVAPLVKNPPAMSETWV